MTETPLCEVWFYQLERTAIDQALPELLERTLARGWRALVRFENEDRLAHMDSWLWTWRDDAFTPHGQATEPQAERQPILLSLTGENVNRAQVLFLVDGSEAGDISPYERCIVLFDGRDPDALANARRRWPEFKTAGYPVSYWRQTERGWEKQS